MRPNGAKLYLLRMDEGQTNKLSFVGQTNKGNFVSNFVSKNSSLHFLFIY